MSVKSNLRHIEWKIKKAEREDKKARQTSNHINLINSRIRESVKERFFRPPYGKVGEVGACYAKVSR